MRERQRGLDAYCDVYPYIASWTELATILPAQARHGGVDATLERLSDPETAASIELYLRLHQGEQWRDMLVTEVGSEKNARVAGMRMDEIASAWRMSPAAAAVRLLREERLEVGAAFFKMCEDDVATVISADFCCVGSDASIRALDGPTARGVPHPRTFGTFPRVFGRYVRGRKTLDLVEAVRRMTSLPASIFGLRDRGSISVGNYADLVVFDAEVYSRHRDVRGAVSIAGRNRTRHRQRPRRADERSVHQRAPRPRFARLASRNGGELIDGRTALQRQRSRDRAVGANRSVKTAAAAHSN